MKFLKLALVAAAASVAMGGAVIGPRRQRSEVLVQCRRRQRLHLPRHQPTPTARARCSAASTASYGIGYAGVWASNVDFGTENPDTEIDLYAGVKPTVGAASLDFGVIYYGYDKDKNGAGSVRLLRSEGAAASTAVGLGTIGGAVFTTRRNSRARAAAPWYGEINGSAPIGEKLDPERRPRPSGSRRRRLLRWRQQQLGTTYNVGITAAVTDYLSADLRYSDTNQGKLGDAYGQALTVSLKAAF